MRNELPLISLGIPVYNAADLLERTLLSALNQTYPNIEYVFVDDKGNSMDIVYRLMAEHPRGKAIRIIDQGHNQGIGAARNAILDHATGEYLFTMDCDDVIVPQCIEILYKKMCEHPVDFVAASFVRMDMEGKRYQGCQYADTLIEGGHLPVAHYRYGQGKEIYVASWNKLYRLDFLKKHAIRCKAGHFNEDPWFTYQAILSASSCRLIPDCTLHYTYNPQSVSGASAALGYSEKIGWQYADIQELKSAYIAPFTEEGFYNGLMLDILKMSLYNAYRIAASDRISRAERDKMLNSLLERHFPCPKHWKCDRNLLKALPLMLFYTFPMCMKKNLLLLMLKINLKSKLKRWLHF